MRQEKNTIKSKKSVTQTQTRGGDMISSGAYGCIFRPSLPCETDLSTNPVDTSSKVSKVFEKETDSNKEWQETFALRNIDPTQKYFIYPITQCRVSRAKIIENENYMQCSWLKDIATNDNLPQTVSYPQLVSKFGGQTVYDYITGKFENGQQLYMQEYIDLLFRICTPIYYLNSKGFAHQDIKPNNLLIDSTGTVRLIDFGFMVSHDNMFKSENQFLSKNYWIHPPEYEYAYHVNQSDNTMTDKDIRKLIWKRIYQFASVFSKKDTHQIGYYFSWYWPSLIELEKQYLQILVSMKNMTDKQKKEFPLKSDCYALGVMMMYLVQFVKDFDMNSDFSKTYISLVHQMTHPDPSKRYSIEKVYRTLKKWKSKDYTKDTETTAFA